QQAVSLDEVGQELVCGDWSRGRIDYTSGAGLGDERVQLFALRGGGSVGGAFCCEPDPQSFSGSPGVEQDTAHEEDLEALTERPLAAHTLCHELAGERLQDLVRVPARVDPAHDSRDVALGVDHERRTHAP